MRHSWRASLRKFCRLKVLLIQFFPIALSVIFLLVCEVQLRLCGVDSFFFFQNYIVRQWNYLRSLYRLLCLSRFKLLRVMNAVKTLIKDLLIFSCFFFRKKVLKCSNNYRCAFIHIDARMNALRFICTT